MSADEQLLRTLEVHGKKFLQSFNLPDPHPSGKRKATKRIEISPTKRARLSEDEPSSDEEWHGIQHSEEICSEGDDDSDADSNADNYEQDDDGLTTGRSVVIDDKTIVFSDRRFDNGNVSKAKMKAFMSSKVSKLRSEDSDTGKNGKNYTAEEEEDERTNAENDALLHKLVHTQLLSGSLNPDLDISPSHRRKALAGRLMELAGVAKLGKGESLVREAEKTKAGKRVREGLTLRQKEQEKQQLQEAKNLGNYHPALKKLFGASAKTSSSRLRSRGLGMGVGKFSGGVLRLRKQDILSVTGEFQRHSGKQNRKRK